VRGLLFQTEGSLDHLKVAELPPPVPKVGEVLVKVLAAAINPSDAARCTGKISLRQAAVDPSRPAVQ
jgi:NADPH:quinone reductase-like Zn-dependent oxidoreductase